MMRLFIAAILSICVISSVNAFPNDSSDLFCYSDLVVRRSEEPSTAAPASNLGLRLYRGSIFCGLGIAFKVLSDLAQWGWGVCKLFSSTSSVANEFSLFSWLCDSAAKHALFQLRSEWESGQSVPFSHFSWEINQALLSTIPAFSTEDSNLLHFLKQHWLAKSAGFSSLAVNWVYPCFGIHPQVRPLTNHCYTRLPSNGLSEAYKQGVELWKQALPHPHNYPLILTRPSSLQDYFSSAFDYVTYEDFFSGCPHEGSRKIIVDVTDWGTAWNGLFRICQKRNIDIRRVICIERLQEKEIGGIRILALEGQSQELLEEHHRYLLEWISYFGLSANLIEVDRWCAAATASPNNSSCSMVSNLSKEEFLSLLNRLEGQWKEGPRPKMIMLQGTLQVLKGLFANVAERQWQRITQCPTRAAVAEVSINKIKQQLEFLENRDTPFIETISHLEQIHADFCSLLELFSPFSPNQFSTIYQDLLPIPPRLKPLTSCGIHSSAMTSLAGILKAARQTLGRAPRVLYGEHTYFECVNAVKKAASASSVAEATAEDWKQVDLLLAQFNPVLSIQIHSGYKVDDIEVLVRKCLSGREGHPLTLALDCTIDYIHSPRVAKLLNTFQQEIEAGALNIVGYRSGNKFDLFGMDNYCGAPFFMIHNRDPKWTYFRSLLIDSALQADRLSLNWFCLAYQYAAPQLELYREQIFQNTRALLKRLPPTLHQPGATYWVSPVEEGAEAAFIDIKITGLFHQRGSALVSGSLYMRAMEEGLPIFNRPSLGFYYPNFTFIFGTDNSTLRLTLGLDPSQVELFAQCLERIDGLNRH